MESVENFLIDFIKTNILWGFVTMTSIYSCVFSYVFSVDMQEESI